MVIAWPSMTSIPYEGLGRGRIIRLDEDDMNLIKQRSLEIGVISGEYSRLLKVQQGTRILSVDVHGVQPEFGEVRNLIPQKGGRFLDPLDERLKRRVALDTGRSHLAGPHLTGRPSPGHLADFAKSLLC